MADYIIQSETLDNIANAINAKTGGTAQLTPAQMVDEIAAIQTGGGGELPIPITQFATGTFTLAEDTDTIQINHGIGYYPTLIVLYPNFNYSTYRTANKGISPSYIYNNFYIQAYTINRYIHNTSGNILANTGQPIATNFEGNAATISSYSQQYPFPSKWHRTEGDDGEIITWRWVAIRFQT